MSFDEFNHKKDFLEVLKLDPKAVLPTRAHPDDAGLDLYALEAMELPPGVGIMVSTGIALALPAQSVGLIADRSSMGKKGIKTFGGVVDAGYRGEIKILLRNLSSEHQSIQAGERVAQMLILPILTPAPSEVQSLGTSARAEAGFGSTGR